MSSGATKLKDKVINEIFIVLFLCTVSWDVPEPLAKRAVVVMISDFQSGKILEMRIMLVCSWIRPDLTAEEHYTSPFL